jgi:hypothetical protein
MIDVSGRAFLDGIDLWTVFSVFIEEGSADFLRYPPKKESITRDWGDSHGVEVDLSRVFFGSREGVLNCAIITTSETDFWLKHNALISQLVQPEKRRLSFKSHGERSYYVYYKECNNYKSAAPLKGETDDGLFAYRFSLVIVEPEPVVDASHVFLVNEDDVFIIT